MRNVAALLTLGLVAACATEPMEEQPLTPAQRAEFLASLPLGEREPFETLLWSREVDPEPIGTAFGKCVDEKLGVASGADQAGPIIDACFPIIERYVRGRAMEVPVLATGPSGDDLNNWASEKADEQKAEFKALLVKRFEARANIQVD